jgi:hypothetical protein
MIGGIGEGRTEGRASAVYCHVVVSDDHVTIHRRGSACSLAVVDRASRSLAFAMLALERRSWSLVFGCCAVSFSRRRLIAACARRVSVGGCARYSLALATPAPHDQGPPPGSYKTSTRNM